MKKYSLAILLSTLAFGISTAFYALKLDRSADSVAKHELMINMTSDATQDAHSTLMGLHFAHMALENGMEVTVFLNVDGVKLLGQAGNKIDFGTENLYDLLMQFQKDGGTILACPHCMMINEIDKERIPDVVTVSSPEIMSAKLKAGPTVFTY